MTNALIVDKVVRKVLRFVLSLHCTTWTPTLITSQTIIYTQLAAHSTVGKHYTAGRVHNSDCF